MPRLSRDPFTTIEQVNNARSILAATAAGPAIPNSSKYGYLFPALQEDPGNLVVQNPNTVGNLIALGNTMSDPGVGITFDSSIPSVYTYFSQFVAHDLTLEAFSQDLPLDRTLVPLTPDEIKNKILNQRTGTLDLDSIYAPALIGDTYYPVPRDADNPDKLAIDRAVESNIPHPPGTDPDHSDLPRQNYNEDKLLDRVARIGDVRNDLVLILSQLHLAFLRAHNNLVDQGKSFDEARRLLLQHYQWIVIKDFLNRVADPAIVEAIGSGALRIFEPSAADFFLPLEFTGAAYRFGHSMVRSTYNYNENFENKLRARLYQLSRALALGDYHHILESWIIQWDRFVEGGTNVARLIDTRLVDPLAALTDALGNPLKFEGRLAVRDLLRGYILRLPTGQAVAKALGCQVMTDAELEEVAGAVSDDQKQILRDPRTKLSGRTPLWFYILAEAASIGTGRLGCVGSMLVASVLIGVVRSSPDSILSEENWSPTLGQTQGRFDLPDLLRLAQVLN